MHYASMVSDRNPIFVQEPHFQNGHTVVANVNDLLGESESLGSLTIESESEPCPSLSTLLT